MGNQPKIELLQAEVDENDQSFFQVLVDGLSIKYITVEPGIYSTEDMCFGSFLVSVLPTFPTGDWNDGLVAEDAKDGRPFFARVCLASFPGVRKTWHETYITVIDLRTQSFLSGSQIGVEIVQVYPHKRSIHGCRA
jgi:hypothetical protein